MTTLWARQALLPSGWARDVAITIDADGQIAEVVLESKPTGKQVGILMPAPVNAHSHSFQRAMAGLTERRGPDANDSFWTWRQLMYRFLDRLTPDHVEAIAALVQMEMLEAGYATNVEFHYLHHSPDGTPYDRLSEMAERIGAAARQTGVGLTLLPVQYEFGGCDGRPLGPGQIRFGNDPDRFARLAQESRDSIGELSKDAQMGVAPHSLRAVSKDAIQLAPHLAQDGPVHMHLAEQIAEVEEVRAAFGMRPVEWVLEHVEPDEKWCFIHCTQMEPHETQGLAASGAVAGLCPITEASLGDGIFDGVRWMNAGGRIAVGSDSNIRISLCEELRQLEYSQRLRDRSRAALATSDQSTGRRIFDAVSLGGAQAAGRRTGRIEAGFWADLMTLDDAFVDLSGLAGDDLLDTFIFAGQDAMVRDVWSAGRHVVQDGHHVDRARILRAYRRAIADLRDRL